MYARFLMVVGLFMGIGISMAHAITPPLPGQTILPAITKSLYRGMQDNQVKILQECLAKNKNIYPEGLATGYFGALTEKAVQRFQVQYKIVTSGTPETTGFGRVGPLTRNYLNANMCAGSVAPVPTPVPAPLPPLPTPVPTPTPIPPPPTSLPPQADFSDTLIQQAASEINAVANQPLDAPGPGGCVTVAACQAYCAIVANSAECTGFLKP